MASIIKLRINDPSTLRKCALEGHRFTAQEAVKAGFVEQAVPEKEIMPTAFKYAEIFAKKALNRGEAFRLIKTEVHRETIIALLSNELKPGSYLSKL
ncbi:hypothetical protein AX774_g7917 [Zancudomyces culisetae]|uniref:Uncharacterized protein n=1 Tax=Zancudomyces culisetae TaxID=1213189 RepID=A0A1R1PCJ0_ZANCU|nr:hypothetical protein AX774_g7917 [Zancudomyces culisetae]|eukprot:OMH78684.1 hypothetical protein AX774_g7917 [Zancudomyces culisetae]